jgi:hypothetical protein
MGRLRDTFDARFRREPLCSDELIPVLAAIGGGRERSNAGDDRLPSLLRDPTLLVRRTVAPN